MVKKRGENNFFLFKDIGLEQTDNNGRQWKDNWYVSVSITTMYR